MSAERLFETIVKTLADAPCPEDKFESKFWTDGEKIMCKDRERLYGIADLIDDIAGYPMCGGGYCDPEEDKRSGCTDEYTGYYYIELAE